MVAPDAAVLVYVNVTVGVPYIFVPAAWLKVIAFVEDLLFTVQVIVTTKPFLTDVDLLFVTVTLPEESVYPSFAVVTA